MPPDQVEITGRTIRAEVRKGRFALVERQGDMIMRETILSRDRMLELGLQATSLVTEHDKGAG